MKKIKPKAVWDIRVDRASILGSPYKLHTEAKRDEVIDKYEVWFNEQVETNYEFARELNRLLSIHARYDKLNLLCWCVPKRCHAEVIKKWLEEELKNRS